MLSNLTDFQVGWIAGMIDADGWVGLRRVGKYYQPMVTVTSADRRTVEVLLAIAGIGSISMAHQKELNRSPVWLWHVTSKDSVAQLLTVVVNHMVTKQLQATTLIGYCQLHTGYTVGNFDEVFYLKLKELNSPKPKNEAPL